MAREVLELRFWVLEEDARGLRELGEQAGIAWEDYLEQVLRPAKRFARFLIWDRARVRAALLKECEEEAAGSAAGGGRSGEA